MFAGACSCQVEDSHIECQLVVEAYFTLRKTQEPVPVSLNSDRQFSIALHHWAAGAGCDGVRVLWAGCPGCAAAGGRCGRAVRTGGADGRCRRAGGVAGGAAIGGRATGLGRSRETLTKKIPWAQARLQMQIGHARATRRTFTFFR